MAWFGARTLYHHKSSEENDEIKFYEERIVLIDAIDFDEVIAKAEAEGQEYANMLSKTVYLGFVNVYKLSDETVLDKTEVYSLIRESKLNSDDYITAFFDTGTERTK